MNGRSLSAWINQTPVDTLQEGWPVEFPLLGRLAG
jgi:hypothetical protein